MLVKLLMWSERDTGGRKFDPEYNAVTAVPEHFTVKAKSAQESIWYESAADFAYIFKL